MPNPNQKQPSNPPRPGSAIELADQLLFEVGYNPNTHELTRYVVVGVIGSAEEMLADQQHRFRYWSAEWFVEDFPERYRLGWEFWGGRYRVLLTETMPHENADRCVDPYPLAEASLALQLEAAPYLDKLIDELREHFDSQSGAVGREEVPSWPR